MVERRLSTARTVGDRMNEILTAEIRRTLQLLGVRSVDELTPAHVRLP
jgi:L-lactate dehydrogenase (cytochrome)